MSSCLTFFLVMLAYGGSHDSCHLGQQSIPVWESTSVMSLQGEEPMHDAIRARQLQLGAAGVIACALERHGRTNEEVLSPFLCCSVF